MGLIFKPWSQCLFWDCKISQAAVTSGDRPAYLEVPGPLPEATAEPGQVSNPPLKPTWSPVSMDDLQQVTNSSRAQNG